RAAEASSVYLRLSELRLRYRCVLPSDTFLAKGSATLDKLKDLCNEGKEHPSMLLQLYTQAVLDITYFEENQLVDVDFPEESSLQKVKELISILSEPEDLVKKCNVNEEVSTNIIQPENQLFRYLKIKNLKQDSSSCIFDGQNLRSLEKFSSLTCI
uniref:Uncharacterized protein n=1 Tax=Bubo bubo TaxID=30461 RepID=A0A8C0EU63_BUBBB